MSEGAPDDWANERLKTTHAEAREVLNHQLDDISDIDNKAMYTVRVIVVFLGIVVAAFQIGGTNIFNPYLMWPGFLALAISMSVGIITYSASTLRLGPNREYLRGLADGDVDANRWDIDLIYRMGDWVSDNHDDLQTNRDLLTITQSTLILGVLLIALSVAL